VNFGALFQFSTKYVLQDILMLRYKSNMLVRGSADRLFEAQKRIKNELMQLQNHPQLPDNSDTSPFHWHVVNKTKESMPFLHLLVTVAGATPMGSVQIEHEFGEISGF
jgi:hypothetical protein